MISVGCRYFGKRVSSWTGRNFARRSALTFVGGSLKVDWGNQETLCEGTLPTDLIVYVVIRKTSGQYIFGVR